MAKYSGFGGFPGVYRFLGVLGGVLEGRHAVGADAAQQGRFVGADVGPESREVYIVEARGDDLNLITIDG